MKKIVALALFLMLGITGKSFASSLLTYISSTTISSTTFVNGVARSDVWLLNPNESLTYTLTGNATGTMLFQGSTDGSNYVTIVSSTNNSGATLTGVSYSGDKNTFYRWSGSTMTGAGSFILTIQDNDDFVSQVNNRKNVPVFQVWDDTIRFPNSKGFILGDLIQSTATTSASIGTMIPVYLTGSVAAVEGSVLVATTPVAGFGISAVVAPASINSGRHLGIAAEAKAVSNTIQIYTDGIVVALTTGTIIPGDMLGTSSLSAGYLGVTQSSNPVVGIALTNGVSGGGLTKIRMR